MLTLSSRMQSRCVKVIIFAIKGIKTYLACAYHLKKVDGGMGDQPKGKNSSNASSGYWRSYH